MKEPSVIKQNSKRYGLDLWGKPYFSVNSFGHIQVHPQGKSEFGLDLFNIIRDLKNSSIDPPFLIRFPEIIKSQMDHITTCFNEACKTQGYKGRYRGVFPIKVNQKSHVIKDIVTMGAEYDFGLEAGSKPELIIATALMDRDDGLIICNGFKDKNYIEMALMFQKAGKNIILVVERKKELGLILELSRKFSIKPKIGFRLKLQVESSGLWTESSGQHSKFGFTPLDLMDSIHFLKVEGFIDSLSLLHFHIGSQVPTLKPIEMAIQETSRIFSEVSRMGCKIRYIDIGGGLGVDYDGSGTTKRSTNYSPHNYANSIVRALKCVCKKGGHPHPDIISESGRFIVAQSSILIIDVFDSDCNVHDETLRIPHEAPKVLKEFYNICDDIQKSNIKNAFKSLIQKRKEIQKSFLNQELSLEHLALVEKMELQSVRYLESLSSKNAKFHNINNQLKKELTETYFCNFSIFQSLPDFWALSYMFPLSPVHRLDESPRRQVRLVDLTCDSDGKIDQFLRYKDFSVQPYISLHSLKKEHPYYLAIFLIGAYQEILGDLHNLFGNTDIIHIRSQGSGGYVKEHHIRGDSIQDVLTSMRFHPTKLIQSIQGSLEDSVKKGILSSKESGLLLKKFQESLSDYTYLK